MIDVIEFQKRSLPHAHFLIILKPKSKITQPEQFDRFVCAEIPPLSNLYLRDLVLRHMMHGPCGKFDVECPCMVMREGKKVCRYMYPRAFSTFTKHAEDGYPVYRRRPTGESVSIRGVSLDNRWVIPYNPYLLAAFDCHINVEVCSTIKAVKYLYKYVYKGHDKISVSIGQEDTTKVVDDVERFQSARWVSPPEAAWRIFAFDLYDMQPPVMPLQVHLPNQHNIFFNASEKLANVVCNESRSKTVLTEFFTYNAAHPLESKYCFPEFVKHHVWNAQGKCWNKRNCGTIMGRLTFVAPSEGERYYLRLLLTRVVGPCSFTDLSTFNNKLCLTFHEAALERGLVEPDDLVERCLDEAIEIQMPTSLRRLFAMVLIFLKPMNPVRLWERYYPYLSEDYVCKHPNDPQKVLTLTVRVFETFFENMGKSLGHYGLQDLCKNVEKRLRRTRDISDALDAPIPASCMEARKLLTTEHRATYKRIIAHVKEGKPGLFFIDGPGGTGKTFLYNALYAKVRLLNKIVLPIATSAIAASNMPTGRTAHSRFKIPNDCGES